MKPELVAGSPLWQAIFLSFAAVLILFQIARGWRLGLPRQLMRIAALVLAYSAALLGGKLLVPFLRPILRVPDFVIAALGGMILALLVYSLINTVGTILFKRTGQQGSSLVRLVYGMSGAVLGLVLGLFFLWIMIAGVRSLGAVAQAGVEARPASAPDQHSLGFTLARLKKSLELGTIGDVVQQTDVLPTGAYETLGRVGEVFVKPERATRFLSYPGIAELTENPKILALRADPEIARMLEEGRLWELMQDDRLIEAANDPELARQVKKFDLKKALEYAAEE